LGNSPDAFFAQVTKPLTPDTSLHEVVDAKGAEAAIVDGGMLQSYATSYSGRAKRLRVLLSSDNFPESVVAYAPGKVDEDIVRRFRQGMSTAHATPLGRQLLSLWSMAGFQAIPLNYAKQLADCLKAYPPPSEAAK
jgi:ABC-type phosphate/phosphonate transport system substrate-binding protein